MRTSAAMKIGFEFCTRIEHPEGKNAGGMDVIAKGRNLLQLRLEIYPLGGARCSQEDAEILPKKFAMQGITTENEGGVGPSHY